MKTRKVGKIVSLLVAIVLVATIMIPAAGVLADSTKYADVTWLDVGTFTELHEAIEKANDASAKLIGPFISALQLTSPARDRGSKAIEMVCPNRETGAKCMCIRPLE